MCGFDIFFFVEIKLLIVINWFFFFIFYKKRNKIKNKNKILFLEKYRYGLYIFMKISEENKCIFNEKVLSLVLCRN